MIKCDFCNSNNLKLAYHVPDSLRGMNIMVCTNCGLTQSHSTISYKPKTRLVKASSDSDWGNIRHGKGLRLDDIKELLFTKINWGNVHNVLDIGSNRGDFIHWIRYFKKNINIVGVEPDGLIINTYDKLDNVKVLNSKLENADLNGTMFDLIYCIHTLEHATSASKMISRIYDLLAINGYCVLEVPNIDLLKYDYNVEEFFIDKHTFHFNKDILIDYLKTICFIILNDVSSSFNITLLLSKTFAGKLNPVFKPAIAGMDKYNISLINNYLNILERNRSKLKYLGSLIHSFSDRQKIAIWGAGRILDALVKYGGLVLNPSTIIVDEYLYRYISEIHDLKIQNPDMLRVFQPQVVIILARSSANIIETKVRKFGIKNVIKYEDLFLSINTDY